MQTQVQNAKQADGNYDFSGSFAPMASLFQETDIVCVNFEGAMAGADAGYSEPRPTAPPARVTSASTVGFPLESRISLPVTFSICK